jgi:hypothetical protein
VGWEKGEEKENNWVGGWFNSGKNDIAGLFCDELITDIKE